MNTKFTRIHHQLHFELFSSSIVISLPRQCRLNFMLNFRGAAGGSWITVHREKITCFTFHRENNACFYIPLFNHIFCGLVGGAYIFCEQSSGNRRVRVRMSASVGGWMHAYVRACVRACERVLVPVYVRVQDFFTSPLRHCQLASWYFKAEGKSKTYTAAAGNYLSTCDDDFCLIHSAFQLLDN